MNVREKSGVWLVGILSLALLITTTSTLAQSGFDPVGAMQAANRQYEAEHFAEAAAAYEAILDRGLRHSDLFYNLGNAYFKQGDVGRAILNYRRAQRLNPRDPDIEANLAIARGQTLDRFEGTSEGPLVRWVQTAEAWLTLNEAALLALALWFLLAFCAGLAVFLPGWRRPLRRAMLVLAVLLGLGLISIAGRLYQEVRLPAAVILAPEVDVTSGPGSSEQYLLQFSLHAGTEVYLIEERPGWRRIALPGDLQGWVPEDAVEAVID
ncbi:MAG: tetratricopeptide repeat protein [Anaerolineae bacterium]